MPYLIPTRTPLTPEHKERGFGYLPALQSGGGTGAAGRAEAGPEPAFVLLRLAEDRPVTAVDGEAADPCTASFVLDEVGCVVLSALRDGRDSPPQRCPASTAASSASSRSSTPTTTESPAPPWRRCATNTWRRHTPRTPEGASPVWETTGRRPPS
ncbi:hypothetical protein SUDANB120_06122 [Streptomyces sp. enrichment culture]|uniref:hypothetical protein n=1 Tax=Streptomyces sp. enrichment culture TaxID=1795815 RepID=UPI003F568475